MVVSVGSEAWLKVSGQGRCCEFCLRLLDRCAGYVGYGMCMWSAVVLVCLLAGGAAAVLMLARLVCHELLRILVRCNALLPR